MPIFAIISLLLSAIRYLPDLIKLIKAILDLIRSLKGHPEFQGKVFLARLHAAIKLAREKKDTSELEKLHQELVKACQSDSTCWVQSLREQEGVANDSSGSN